MTTAPVPTIKGEAPAEKRGRIALCIAIAALVLMITPSGIGIATGTMNRAVFLTFACAALTGGIGAAATGYTARETRTGIAAIVIGLCMLPLWFYSAQINKAIVYAYIRAGLP